MATGYKQFCFDFQSPVPIDDATIQDLLERLEYDFEDMEINDVVQALNGENGSPSSAPKGVQVPKTTTYGLLVAIELEDPAGVTNLAQDVADFLSNKPGVGEVTVDTLGKIELVDETEGTDVTA